MTDSSGAKLALIIPTFRWNDLARDTLAQAAAIGCDDIRVHIGDNSAEPAKHRWLADLAARSRNVAVECHPHNLGADANWLFLVKAQTAPLIAMAADDDAFVGAYFKSAIALMERDAACSTASGLHVSVAKQADGKPPVIYTPPERRESDPLARIKRYFGENSICYAISRRPVVAGFAAYVEQNPLSCPFYDYMLAFHLLSIGTYRLDRNGFAYIYDHTNWQQAGAFLRSNDRWYTAYGMPTGFGLLTRLHWAIVGAHFFSSRFRDPSLHPAMARAIADHLFARYRREFVRDYYRAKKTIDALLAADAAACSAFRRLLSEPYCTLAGAFDDFSLVLAHFAPEIAARHRQFQSETLMPSSGAIKPERLAPLRSLSMARAVLTRALAGRATAFEPKRNASGGA